MITPQRLARYLLAEPFRPFRIRLTTGQVLEIRDPDMVALGRSTAQIDTYLSDDPELSKQREQEIPLHQVESVELLDVTTAQEGKP